MKQKNDLRLTILICVISISGFSQGLLLPLIAIIFEQNGVSSTLNGLNATALYVGVLIASPFMEKPLRKIGYKPMIIIGGLLVIVSLATFPVWQSFWFWFALRVLIGIGDHMLHFATQTWITSFSDENRRGRNIALYGLFFGIGFTAGPLMTRLLEINPNLPFYGSAILSLIVWGTLFLLKNEWPEQDLETAHSSSLSRFSGAFKGAWVALLPPFAYGFLEASLHGNFPVYALRLGIEVNSVSFILPAFAAGSILSQLPLGTLSDKIGRKNVLNYVLFIGFLCFLTAGFAGNVVWILFTCFLIAGISVGSIFSLGISYMADLLPKHLLPAGNILCGIFFSLGSIIGPLMGGVFIQWFENSFFYVISLTILVIWLLIFTSKENGVYRSKISQF